MLCYTQTHLCWLSDHNRFKRQQHCSVEDGYIYIYISRVCTSGLVTRIRKPDLLIPSNESIENPLTNRSIDPEYPGDESALSISRTSPFSMSSDTRPVDNVNLVFPCGHGGCRKYVDKFPLVDSKVTCPFCREIIIDPRRLRAH